MNIEFVDTTLRDGEQSAGVVFTLEEKKCILKLLDNLGCEWIEAGIPAIGDVDRDFFESVFEYKLKKSKLIAWNRCNCEDVLKSIKYGFKFIHISVPISDDYINYKLNDTRHNLYQKFKEATLVARNNGCIVFAGAEDASRATISQFIDYANFAYECGVKRVRYADTVGGLEPLDIYLNFPEIVKKSPIPIEFHAHNDFGLGVANALAAVQGGASFVSTTICGIGERAGNVCFESFIKVFKSFCGEEKDKYNLEFLLTLNDKIEAVKKRCYKF